MANETLEHRSARLDVRGMQVHLLRGGSGHPVLFLHGAGGAGAWLPFHGLLAGRGLDVLQFGDMPNDRARASMELFASQVMPALKAHAGAVAA